MRRLDARRFALLAAIAGIDAALRLVLVTGAGGSARSSSSFSPPVTSTGPPSASSAGHVAARVGGGHRGYRALAPYEMFGCGWTGAAAGIAGLRRSSTRHAGHRRSRGRQRGRRLRLRGAPRRLGLDHLLPGSPSFGFLPGAGTGVLLQRFGRFYLATSVVWDSFRAAGDALAVIVLGLPVLAALARVKSRLTFTVSSPGGGDGARPSSDGAVPWASGAGLAAQPPPRPGRACCPGRGLSDPWGCALRSPRGCCET